MTALLGQWNQARWGKTLRRPVGWWRGRTHLVYVHLTETEWITAGEAAQAEGLTRERWLVGLCQTALASPSARLAQIRATEDAAAIRLQARRRQRTGAE